jgi:DNA-directed RNA polymerase specialized sigma subunit
MRGLNKLYYLKIDIENIKEEIKSLPTISSPQITGMPHGTGVSNPIESYFLKKEKLIKKLNLKIEKYTEELLRIEDIIDRIDDEEIRAIARMRFVQCLTWEEIGERVHLERTTCSKKLKKYIESMEI